MKLLDFGIAKLVDAAGLSSDDDLTIAPFTPDYAAPEQLSGQAVTTATDVYALGVLLFELLTGQRPLRTLGLPSNQVMSLLLDRTAPAPSKVAADSPHTRTPPRLLRGDLDSIVAKCLRKEGAHRYETVNGLKIDVERHLRNEPVLAREGARLYVMSRMVHRYRWAVAGVAAVIITLGAGLGTTLWQATLARREAARATATKDFLLGIFRANDLRVATDMTRGETTARQLLDVGSARIENDLSQQPDLQIELLGMVATMYGDLNDEERYAAMQKRRIELAKIRYGSTHPIVLEGLLAEADAACARLDYIKANRLLDDVDRLLERSNQNRSTLRADWWRIKARALGVVANSTDARANALESALKLYADLAPHSSANAATLNMVARDYLEHDDDGKAEQYLDKAVAVAEGAPDRNDALISNLLTNLARAQARLGDFAAADRTYVHAEDTARRTWGVTHANFWLISAYHAQMVHLRGERERADELFRNLLAMIPKDWKTNSKNIWVREIYGECLASEGRAVEAIPLLEAALKNYLSKPAYESDAREARRKLGDAYERMERSAEARVELASARAEFLAKDKPGSSWILRMRERWARFLLDHSRVGDKDFDDAEAEFRTILDEASELLLPETALAHAGLARVANLRGHPRDALEQSRLAMAALEGVRGLYDVRVGPMIWLVRSAALLSNGDAASARVWADKALHASRRFDAPSSAAIAVAEESVRAAGAVAPL